MRAATACILGLLLAAPVVAQTTLPTGEAYRRLQQRQAEREAAASTQPVIDQLAALQAENTRLRAIIEDLKLQLDALKNQNATSATPAATGTRINARCSLCGVEFYLPFKQTPIGERESIASCPDCGDEWTNRQFHQEYRDHGGAAPPRTPKSDLGIPTAGGGRKR